MIKKIDLSYLVLLLLSITAKAQVPQKPDPKFEIYLLMGQSNMAGRGIVTTEYANMKNAHVVILNKEGIWSTAKHPLHYDKPKVAGVGPGLSFGIAMAEADTAVKIGLVPCAVGGTSIDVWKPEAFDQATNTHPYDDAVSRIEEAMRYGVIKGMIWLQGEANSGISGMPGYLDKLAELVSRVRTLVGDEELPVVIGELGRYRASYLPFNDMIAEAPAVIKNLSVASSESLNDKGDLTHFDSASATIYGQRFARKMLILQKKM